MTSLDDLSCIELAGRCRSHLRRSSSRSASGCRAWRRTATLRGKVSCLFTAHKKHFRELERLHRVLRCS